MSLAQDMAALIEQMQAALRARRDEIAGLGEDVAELRRDARQFVVDCRADRQASGREEREALQAYAVALKTGTSDTLRGLRRSRRDSAAQLRSGLGRAAKDVASEIRGRLAGLGAERSSAAKALRGELSGFATELQQTVRRTLDEQRRERASARRAWTSQQAPAAGPVPGIGGAPTAPPPAAEEAPPPAAREDLTEIMGIGPVIKERLTAVGITTFAELAEADPESLREQLGETGRLADIRSWIAQAARKV